MENQEPKKQQTLTDAELAQAAGGESPMDSPLSPYAAAAPIGSIHRDDVVDTSAATTTGAVVQKHRDDVVDTSTSGVPQKHRDDVIGE